jgi:hypothetical protein
LCVIPLHEHCVLLELKDIYFQYSA